LANRRGHAQLAGLTAAVRATPLLRLENSRGRAQLAGLAGAAISLPIAALAALFAHDLAAAVAALLASFTAAFIPGFASPVGATLCAAFNARCEFGVAGAQLAGFS